MNINQTLKTLSLVASIGTFTILYILFWGSGAGIEKFITFGLFSALIGFNIYFPTLGSSAKTTSGSLAAVGTATGIGLSALLISLISISLYVNEHTNLSSALNVLAFILILFSVGTSHITAQHVDKITEEKAFNSDHTLWEADIRNISSLISDESLKNKFLKMADDAVYLTRDPSRSKLEINGEIKKTISHLKDNASTSSAADLEVLFGKLSHQLASRETQIKQARTQT